MALSPITACVVDGKSTLFFVDDDDNVRTYTAADEIEKPKGRTNYSDKKLNVGGQDVQSQVKDMVALSYTLRDSGTLRSRLFYADQNRILQGLEKEGSADWVPSGVGDLKAKVAEGSPVTALVSDSAGIKVFYYKQGDAGSPWVAWWTGDGPWQTARTSR